MWLEYQDHDIRSHSQVLKYKVVDATKTRVTRLARPHQYEVLNPLLREYRPVRMLVRRLPQQRQQRISRITSKIVTITCGYQVPVRRQAHYPQVTSTHCDDCTNDGFAETSNCRDDGNNAGTDSRDNGALRYEQIQISMPTSKKFPQRLPTILDIEEPIRRVDKQECRM
jgi:hypothetical protein